MKAKRNFFDTIDFLYNLGKCFGLSCYSLMKNQQDKYEVSFEIFNFLQLFAFVALYVTMIYRNIINELKLTNGENNTVIFNTGQRILVLVSLWAVFATIVQILLMRQTFWEIVNSLHAIDNQVYVIRLLNSIIYIENLKFCR